MTSGLIFDHSADPLTPYRPAKGQRGRPLRSVCLRLRANRAIDVDEKMRPGSMTEGAIRELR